MRPLHGLIGLLALVALLVGGLFWLSGKRTADTLERSAAEAPLAPGKPAPEAELSATDAPDAKAERAAQPAGAVKLEGSAAASDLANGLQGRVVGADGQPVPAAKVYAAPSGEFDFLPLDAADSKLLGGAKRAQAVSDAQGRFQLPLSGQTHVRLAVRASGFAPLDAERTLARGERDLGDVALEQGVVLEGRVIDQTGRPVAEAQIYSRPRTAGFGIEMMGGRGRPPLATTDAQGRFKIDMLASGPWRMLVNSDDHPDKSFDGESERPGAVTRNLEFALEEGAQISGRVTGAAGEALSKLQVNAQQRSENDDANGEGLVFGPEGFVTPRKAKVGADGSFVARGLKPNQNYRLAAQPADNGFFGYGMGARGGVSAKSGDRGIEVPFKPAAAIVCQVVDAATGKPITEMDVKAGYGWSMPLMDADNKPKTSFPDGNVRFDRLPPRFGGGSGLKLRIDATGYKSYESPELTAVQGQDLDLGVVRLERAPVCRVQVLDLSTGQPIAGAEVLLREDTGNEGNPFSNVQIRRAGGSTRTVNDQGQSQGTTGADGTVVLSSFPGKQAKLKVKHDDYAVWQSGPLTLASGSDHQETVKLARGGEVLVTVQDSKGQPVAGVEIEHSSAAGTEQSGWMRRMNGEGTSRTDARGELVFAHLEAGTHRFRVSSGNGPMVFGGGGGAGSFQATFVMDGSGGAEPQEDPWSSVEVLEGGNAPLKLLAPARASVVGRVREGGKALAGASVRLEAQREGSPGMPDMPFFGGQNGPRTNGSGEYKQEGVKPGKYSVHVTHPSRAMGWEGELEVAEGELRYDIELPIAIVEGRVLAPDGKPIAGARISAERAQEKSAQTQMVFNVVMAGDNGDVMSFGGSGGGEAVRSDADGRYTLRGLLTDTDLVVHATGKDFSPANSEKFRCAPDQTVRGIDVHPKQGGILEVHVTRAGQAATGVLVNAFHKGKDGTEDNQQSEMTGPGGVAHFTGLEPGEWEYSVTDFSASPDTNAEPQESPRKAVEIKPGETSKSEHELH